MAVSVVKVVILCIFLFIGMVLGGVLMQPRASVDVWSIKESDFPNKGAAEDKLNFLLNYAILAPSSHNTQPWKFNVTGDEIRLFADKTKWLEISDADQRELYISQGTALENLILAATHFGYDCSVTYPSGNGSLAAVVKLTPAKTPANDTMLFEAITADHSSQNSNDVKAIPKGTLQALQNNSGGSGIKLSLTTNEKSKNEFRDIIISADQKLFTDPNYKSELGYWLGRGTMGPTGIQAVLAQLRVLFLDVSADQAKKDSGLVNSSPVLGFISSDENDRISQIRAGQLLERVRLEAAASGIGLQPMSQALEVPETKANLSEILPQGSGDPQYVFVLGYNLPLDEHTPRTSLKDSIVQMNWTQKK